MAATIKDVARAAGVSVATVSRTLNGAANVLPQTRQRIEQAAQALQWSPSAAARSLINRRTDTIGALLPDLHGEFFSELIRGIDQAARARGLHLLLSSSHGDAAEAAAALRAMSGRVDGLLLMSPHADAGFLTRDIPAGLPLVLMNAGAPLPGRPAFMVDNHGGAKAMTEHLRAGGARRVAFLAGPADNFEAAERLRGHRDGLAPGAEPWVWPGDFSEAAGERTGAQIAALPPAQRPDALFCANDTMAIGCLMALRAAGLRVPQDIALAGFDDIPIARYVQPALTTVQVPIAALGVQAFEALVDALDEKQATAQVPAATVMPVALVLRQSCRKESPRSD